MDSLARFKPILLFAIFGTFLYSCNCSIIQNNSPFPFTSEFENILDASSVPHIHGKTIYVFWSKDKGYEVKIFGVESELGSTPNNLDWISKAHYQNYVNKTGWAYLEVETKYSWPNEMQATAAGIAEGYLTRDLIYFHWTNLMKNFCHNTKTSCKFIYKFISENFKWMNQEMSSKTSYWHQMSLIGQQINGLYAGYKMAANGTKMDVIPLLDFLLMNVFGDLGDLDEALNPNPNPNLMSMMRIGHCSALIKLIQDRDVYFSHVTWNSLTSMLRIIKRYNFAYRLDGRMESGMVPAESISFSSYPAALFSLDDFYVLSSGLAVMETTINNYNRELWANVKPTGTILSSFRTMVANRLAKNGQMWTRLFSRYNSGTYNNQWMVLDYNLVQPGRTLPGSGVLWVAEQLPGIYVAKDQTSLLKKQGYFASYNSPFYKEIFEGSGTKKMVDKFGDFFTYESTPRAKIFKREQAKIEDLDSMMRVMRYNDYTHDEFSKCACEPPYSAVAAISSRGDLNPINGTYPFPLLGHRSSAGTDMKLTNLDMFLLEQFVAISGPTYDPLPPFDWRTTDFQNLSHIGHPDRFEFTPVIHPWKWL